MEKLMFAFLSLLTFKIVLPVKSNYINKMQYKFSEKQIDGPYVYYKGGQIFAKYIIEANGLKIIKTDSILSEQKDNLSLDIATDIPGKSFQVKLKKELQNEKSEFAKVKKLLALSDIEGNFYAFRKLLLANNVIDENLKWQFGDGQLVLIGDFFDRGEQVTEVLWFTYYLEEEAKLHGGYVHFILGNHEIMNLTGDVRYTPQKYLEHAALMHQNYTSLYDKNTELGKWLRTKNIIEKIGDVVFTHGGISADINKMKLSVPGLNKLARPYYDDTTYNYTDHRLDIILGDFGPFWYRGYYDGNNPGVSSQIDNTLSLFNAQRIATGHTIIADTISVLHNGKLLNTDVHHAEGKSEALLIEDNKYYRVNAAGKKVLLMEATLPKD